MKKEATLYGVIGLLAGLLIAGAGATLAVNNDYRGMMRMMGMNMSRVQDENAGHMSMSMDSMRSVLQDRTGDDFDANFITMMIAHHQGAINMAHQAKQSAKHQELKDLAEDIVSAQSKEIDMMQTWETAWGYKDASTSHMIH